MHSELSGYKKTPVPNRGFVPGHQEPYSFLGPEQQIYACNSKNANKSDEKSIRNEENPNFNI